MTSICIDNGTLSRTHFLRSNVGAAWPHGMQKTSRPSSLLCKFAAWRFGSVSRDDTI
jgi:hypothetical protein